MGCDRELSQALRQCECMRERMAKLEEALRYIAEFDAQMKMHPAPAHDAPMNVMAYAFALGAVQGRARAALASLRDPSEAPEEGDINAKPQT